MDTMRGWGKWLTAAAMALGALSVPGLAAAADPTPSPALTVNPVQVNAGDRITVIGTGWPGSQLVDISICGNGGDGGSASCNRGGAATVGVGGDGQFGATLMAAVPPVACPCVVRATSGQWAAVQPLDVIGAPVRTAPAPAAVPTVGSVSVSGSGPPAAWFGGPAERDVSVTVSNPSGGVVRDARVEVRWGDQGSEQSRVIDGPDAIAAGSDAVVTTKIELDAMTWGDVPVRARVVTTGEPTWVEATTSTYPWGLLLAAFVLLQIVVIAIVRRNRRRRREREAEVAAGAGVPPERDGGLQTVLPVPEVAVVESVQAEAEPEPIESAGGASHGSAPDLELEPEGVSAGGGGVALAAPTLAASAVGIIDRPADGVTPALSTVMDHNLTGPGTAAPWTGARIRIR